MLLTLTSAVWLLAGFGQAATVLRRQGNSTTSSSITLPADDPFYHPTTFTSLSPGAVIDSRMVDTAISQLPLNLSVQAYQVSYRTSGPAGEPLTAITTVWVPAQRQKDLLVAYNSAEDSSNINCAPSYSFRTGVNVSKLGTDTAGDYAVIGFLLLRGYVVISPDYESNELAAFGIGALAAHGVLDGIRAAIAFNSTGLSKNGTKVGIFGYSGGAIATGWAVQQATSYAPELNIVGASLGGLPANLTNNGLFLDGTLGSGFIPINWAGLVKYYTGFASALKSILTPNGTAAIALANTSCLDVVLEAYPLQSFFGSTKYQTLGSGFIANSSLVSYFAAQTLAVNNTNVPKVPLYASHCVVDQTVPFGQAQKAYMSWCGFGSGPITFQGDLNPNCTHTREFVYALPSFLDHLANSFAGVKMNSTCSFTNRTLNEPAASALGANASTLYGTYLAASS